MDPTLAYCKLDKESTYDSTARNRSRAHESPNIFRQWVVVPTEDERPLVWRDLNPREDEQQESRDYTYTSTEIDPESLHVTAYGDGVPLDRYEWLSEFDTSLRNFFGAAVEEFSSPKSLVFANIDSIVNFIGRSGGYIARNEVKEYSASFSGSLALAGLGYCLYRIPTAEVLYLTENKIAPFWIPTGSHYVLEGYGQRFFAGVLDPEEASGSFVAPSAIAERFPGPVHLIVADYDFPLLDIDRVLRADGHLILFLPGDIDSNTRALLANYRDVIDEVSARFSKLVIFSPLALLGRGVVIVATEVHPRYDPESAHASEISRSIESYLETVSKELTAQFSLPWVDIDSYNHEKAAIAWNVF